MVKIYDHSSDVIKIGDGLYDKNIVERTVEEKDFCGAEFRTADDALISLEKTWKDNLERLSAIYTEGTPAEPWRVGLPLLPHDILYGPAPECPMINKVSDTLVTGFSHRGYWYNNDFLEAVTDFEIRKLGNGKVLIRSTPEWNIYAGNAKVVRYAFRKVMLDDKVIDRVRKQGMARDIACGIRSAADRGVLSAEETRDSGDRYVDIGSLGFRYRTRSGNRECAATTAVLCNYMDTTPGNVQVFRKNADRFEENKSKVTLESLSVEELVSLRDLVKSQALYKTVPGKEPDITFIEDQSPYYKERTRRNADESDMTVAIAVDWGTAGEKCTKNCAQNSKTFSPVYKKDIPQNKYVPFRFPENGKEQANWAFAVEAAINSQGFGPKQDIRLNVAGNGIYTLSQHGISQEQTDAAVLTAVKYLQKTFNITEIRSGGQTGVDEAGIKAAVQLGIPAKVLAPKGWKFRTEAGNDISDERQFKARFGVTVTEEDKMSGKQAEAAAVRTETVYFEQKVKSALEKGVIKEAGELRDGWARVQSPSGKCNFANSEGKFMTKNWFDSATEFQGGRATVTRDGSRAEINTSGIALCVWKIEQLLKPGPKSPTFE